MDLDKTISVLKSRLESITATTLMLRQMQIAAFDGTPTSLCLTIICGGIEYEFGEMSYPMPSAIANGIVGFLAYVLPHYEAKRNEVFLELQKLEQQRKAAAGE